MSKQKSGRVLAAALAVLLVAGVGLAIKQTFYSPMRISAYFDSAVGIYPGDDARVLGVRVGRIAAIEPVGAQVKMTVDIDRGVFVPADARAIIVTQSLVAARFVQLTPAYDATGATMANDAVIPIERTAVPVEWDEVKTQLMRLATELGPTDTSADPSLARFIESTANAMEGNGEKLRRTLTQMSGLGRILADGSGDIVGIIKNLHQFVGVLRDSNVQIVQFQDRFATLTSVLDDNRSSMDAALTDLSTAVGAVQRFVAGTGEATTEQVERLTAVTQNLVEHKRDLENILHVTPNAIANGLNVYNPNTGTQVGSFVLNNFSDVGGFVCGSIAAVVNVTSDETADLCRKYLGPGLALPNFNNLPLPFNPYLGKAPDNIIYSDPALAPGGAGPSPTPAEAPLPISAFTGLADNPFPAPGVPPPPGAPGPGAPARLPAHPSPALYPGAPLPTPPPGATTLPELLLPAEGPS